MEIIETPVPGPIWTLPRPPEPKKNTNNNDAADLQKVPPFVLLTLQFNIYMPSNVKSCKQIDEKAQTAKFTVFAM